MPGETVTTPLGRGRDRGASGRGKDLAGAPCSGNSSVLLINKVQRRREAGEPVRAHV